MFSWLLLLRFLLVFQNSAYLRASPSAPSHLKRGGLKETLSFCGRDLATVSSQERCLDFFFIRWNDWQIWNPIITVLFLLRALGSGLSLIENIL